MLTEILGAAQPALADAASSAEVKASLIGGLALVVGAVVPAVLGKREKEPKVLKDLRDSTTARIKELTDDRDGETQRADRAERSVKLRDAEIRRLQAMVTGLGGNPFVGQRDES